MKNIIVIADSGSTKTDWRFVDFNNGKLIESVRTIGFNPYLNDTNYIYNTLVKNFSEVPKYIFNDIKEVYFYGAGCSSEEKNKIVYNALDKIFSNSSIFIEHDLIGASRAIFGNKSGVACIIGTGANSCIWDGSKVVENIPSHGYIFGDEGSGSYLGKELLKLYLNYEMDEDMRLDFDNTFNITESDILERTYRKDNPNVFLASFASFYNKYPDSKILRNYIKYGFNEFFHRRVIKYKNYNNYEIGFVGSIAFHFQEELHTIAKMHGLSIKSISKCPIENLVNFHIKSNKIEV